MALLRELRLPGIEGGAQLALQQFARDVYDEFHTRLPAVYLELNGSNANAHIDIGSYNLTTTGNVNCANLTATATVQAEQITSTDDATITDQLALGTTPNVFFDSTANVLTISSGTQELVGAGPSTAFNVLTIDLSDHWYAAKISAAGVSAGIQLSGVITFPDDSDFSFGSSSDVRIRYSSAGNDHLAFGIPCGSAAQSGNIEIKNATVSAGVNDNFAHGTTADPRLYIHSRTRAATATNQWVSFHHDTTDANIVTGLGHINLNPAGNVKFGTAGNWSTGSGATALGSNCPAVAPTAVHGWLAVIAADGDTVYVPAWK